MSALLSLYKMENLPQFAFHHFLWNWVTTYEVCFLKTKQCNQGRIKNIKIIIPHCNEGCSIEPTNQICQYGIFHLKKNTCDQSNLSEHTEVFCLANNISWEVDSGKLASRWRTSRICTRNLECNKRKRKR